MGSGLILLVIVGAWLAVLVPMALRSHESSSSLGTVEKFHDAMRVLSRREAVTRAQDRTVVVPPRPAAAPGPGLSPAARRRRVLLVLLVVALLTLVGALTGPRWLLAPHLVADLLIGAYVGYLRDQTVRRAEREWRAALGERRPARPEQRVSLAAQAAAGVSRPSRVAGVPERMPSRAAAGLTPLARPAARTQDRVPAPARGAQGEAWSPVPVPLPAYLTASKAPRRVLDLTRSGEFSDGVAAAERDLGIDDQGPALEEILDRRRAVND